MIRQVEHIGGFMRHVHAFPEVNTPHRTPATSAQRVAAARDAIAGLSDAEVVRCLDSLCERDGRFDHLLDDVLRLRHPRPIVPPAMADMAQLDDAGDAMGAAERPARWETGVYEDVPAEIYHLWPYASNSNLGKLARSPLHCWDAMYGEQDDDDTKAKGVGTAAHAALLEPELFAERYIVGPDVSRNSNAWKDFVRANPAASARLTQSAVPAPPGSASTPSGRMSTMA
jgi:hypothetical protein